jgi:hypothetical protein
MSVHTFRVFVHVLLVVAFFAVTGWCLADYERLDSLRQHRRALEGGYYRFRWGHFVAMVVVAAVVRSLIYGHMGHR